MLQLISSGWMASWVCIVLPLVDDMGRITEKKYPVDQVNQKWCSCGRMDESSNKQMAPVNQGPLD